MILLDTSGLLAALFSDQQHHEECARALRESSPPRVISPFVLAELDYLITKYAGVPAEVALLEEIERGAYELAMFDEFNVAKAREVIERYSDLNVGLADASIVVLADRHDVRDVLTLDERHFRALRPSPRKRFRILPADGW
jgi:predicted nucleic acid-binding protein